MLSTICFLCWLTNLASAEDPVAPITALALSPDGTISLSGSQAGIVLYGLPSLEAEGKLPTTMSHVHDLAFSPNGAFLVAVGGSPAEMGQIDVYAWPERELVWRGTWAEDVIYAADVSPDGRLIVTADGDRHVAVWDIATGKRTSTLDGHFGRVTSVAFLPDGQRIVSGGVDQSLRVWNLKSNQTEHVLDNHTGAVHALAVCPRKDLARPLIATVAADRTVRFWQPTIGRMVRFARLDAEPLSLAWTRDGSHVAVGCSDGHVRVIDAEDARVTKDIPVVDGRLDSVVAARTTNQILVGTRDVPPIRVVSDDFRP